MKLYSNNQRKVLTDIKVKCKREHCSNFFYKNGTTREYCCYRCKKMESLYLAKELYSRLIEHGATAKEAKRYCRASLKAEVFISSLIANAANREKSSSLHRVQSQHQP